MKKQKNGTIKQKEFYESNLKKLNEEDENYKEMEKTYLELKHLLWNIEDYFLTEEQQYQILNEYKEYLLEEKNLFKYKNIINDLKQILHFNLVL